MSEDGTDREKERSFGLMLCFFSSLIGGMQGSWAVSIAGNAIGLAWFVGATYFLKPDTERDGEQ